MYVCMYVVRDVVMKLQCTVLLALVLYNNCISYVSTKPTHNVDKVDTIGKRVPEIVAEYGYPLETHKVVTDDSYILTIHRIPHGLNNNSDAQNKPVVYIQHGLLCSSADWVLMGPERGLAFLLADLGYDVWLGNARGNYYSRAHEYLDPDYDSSYWDFSWHEIGYYDLPAVIDHILAESKQPNLAYVAHSQGTTAFFVMASTQPEYNDKIRVMIALAPVAYMKHIPNIAIRVIADIEYTGIDRLIGSHEFLPSTEFMDMIGHSMCRNNAPFQILCENILFLIAGYDSKELNDTTIPDILSDTPAGASTKQLMHYGQEVLSGHFRQYDYGFIENYWVYGSHSPPDYELTKVTAPVALLFGDNDMLTSIQDINRLHDELAHNVFMKQVPYDGFNHLDFLWAIDVKTLLYDQVYDLLQRFQ